VKPNNKDKMTVKELKEQLHRHPEDAEVYIEDFKHDSWGSVMATPIGSINDTYAIRDDYHGGYLIDGHHFDARECDIPVIVIQQA
tara:strand:- start:293 stop:547 length:255 start_codon:yes stop_codon:yes gene_type:complete